MFVLTEKGKKYKEDLEKDLEENIEKFGLGPVIGYIWSRDRLALMWEIEDTGRLGKLTDSEMRLLGDLLSWNYVRWVEER